MGRFKKEERATRNLEYWIEANQRTIEMARKIFQKVTCLDMIWHKVPHFSVQHLNNLQSSHWSPQSKQSRMKKCLVVYLLCASSWPEVSNVWFFVKGWFRLHYSPVSGTAPFMSIFVTPILEFRFRFWHSVQLQQLNVSQFYVLYLNQYQGTSQNYSEKDFKVKKI